jgi:hypothetical protein
MAISAGEEGQVASPDETWSLLNFFNWSHQCVINTEEWKWNATLPENAK